jgi:outer membrane protein
MKNTPAVLSTIALIGVIILFVLHFTYHKPSSGKQVSYTIPAGGTGRIAYINIDTLEAHYEYLKVKKEEFNKRQEGMKAELQNSAEQMQQDIDNVKRQAKAGTLTEAQYQAAERRISQMQQSLQTREAALTDQLVKEQQAFNTDLKNRLDKFLEEYNKDKGYDYILSYSNEGHILYANKNLDITPDVVKGMNEENKVDTTSKKK